MKKILAVMGISFIILGLGGCQQRKEYQKIEMQPRKVETIPEAVEKVEIEQQGTEEVEKWYKKKEKDTEKLGGNFELIVMFKDFSVVYYEQSGEIVCVQESKEIGPRKKTIPEYVDIMRNEILLGPQDIDERFPNHGFLTKNWVIYPVFVKDESGIRLEFLPVTEKTGGFGKISNKDLVTEEISWCCNINEVHYGIFDGMVYWLEGANIIDGFFTNDNGYSFKQDFLMVENQIIIHEYEVDMEKAYDIFFQPYEGGISMLYVKLPKLNENSVELEGIYYPLDAPNEKALENGYVYYGTDIEASYPFCRTWIEPSDYALYYFCKNWQQAEEVIQKEK